jgi:hypothetical protein
MDINKIDHATRSVSSVITNPMYISYGLLGITSVILGYYTFFDNNIQEQTQSPVLEQLAPTAAPTEVPVPTEAPAEVPTAEANPGIQLGGTGKKLKKTKKHKSKKN